TSVRLPPRWASVVTEGTFTATATPTPVEAELTAVPSASAVDLFFDEAWTLCPPVVVMTVIPALARWASVGALRKLNASAPATAPGAWCGGRAPGFPPRVWGFSGGARGVLPSGGAPRGAASPFARGGGSAGAEPGGGPLLTPPVLSTKAFVVPKSRATANP